MALQTLSVKTQPKDPLSYLQPVIGTRSSIQTQSLRFQNQSRFCYCQASFFLILGKELSGVILALSLET